MAESGKAAPDSSTCRVEARIFAADALVFLAHFGPQAAYPADLYYVNLRGVFADFRAHRCDPALLGATIHRRLTPRQRQRLVALLPRGMAASVRSALGRAAASS